MLSAAPARKEDPLHPETVASCHFASGLISCTLKEIGYRLGETNALNNIGVVYRLQGKQEKALEFLQGALALSKEIGHRRGESNALNNIGLVHANQGKMEKALEFFQEALTLSKEIGHRVGEADALNHIGTVYANQGKLAAALDRLREAHGLYQTIGAKPIILQRIEEIIQQLTTLQRTSNQTIKTP